MSATAATLDRNGYRKFGLTTGAIVVLLFGLVIPWIFDLGYPAWPWILGGTLGLWALLAPGSLRPVYAGWMKFGQVMNWINTRVILGILFYGVFLPFGLVMRLFGRDPMHRRRDTAASTYRVKSDNHPKDNVERPF
ncbi:MAG: SxtJ family membrane protein [Gammaproteobacteria bacterium]|jgi:hypothetical protein